MSIETAALLAPDAMVGTWNAGIGDGPERAEALPMTLFELQS